MTGAVHQPFVMIYKHDQAKVVEVRPQDYTWLSLRRCSGRLLMDQMTQICNHKYWKTEYVDISRVGQPVRQAYNEWTRNCKTG